MQERPDKTALLMSIGRFLIEEARPALADPRLAFRALIAANLANIVASELASDDAHAARELQRLRAMFPDSPEAAATPAEQRAQIIALTSRLAALLTTDASGESDLALIGAALRESLADKLSIDNPRFDTSLDIE